MAWQRLFWFALCQHDSLFHCNAYKSTHPAPVPDSSMIRRRLVILSRRKVSKTWCRISLFSVLVQAFRSSCLQFHSMLLWMWLRFLLFASRDWFFSPLDDKCGLKSWVIKLLSCRGRLAAQKLICHWAAIKSRDVLCLTGDVCVF